MYFGALILEFRYTGPYTIVKTSNKEKWREATILAFLYTAMIPILGLAGPALSPAPDQWPKFPLLCAGVWLVAFPVKVLYKRMQFERDVKRYQRIDKIIKVKAGSYQNVFAFPLFNWIKIFMPAEYKRFLAEGYPENLDTHKDDIPGT